MQCFVFASYFVSETANGDVFCMLSVLQLPGSSN